MSSECWGIYQVNTKSWMANECGFLISFPNEQAALAQVEASLKRIALISGDKNVDANQLEARQLSPLGGPESSIPCEEARKEDS